jgi:membrane fusion protein (multidrug efflux system)
VLRFSANLEAETAVEVHAQAARLVTELRVEEGDRVRAGDLLARLQDEEQRSELSKVRVELAKTDREYEQQKRLYAENLISEQEFNDATYQKEQLELRLSDAERELSYTEVRAPVAGTVTRRNIQIGDPVQIGQHLFDIVDFDSLVARVYVPEKHLPELTAGIPARIAAPSLARDDYRGAVDRVAPVVDPKTGTVKVTVAVGNQSGLRPGLYVDVDLVTAVHPEALLLPKRALVYDDEQTYAFRMNGEGRAERVRVHTVLSDKRWVEPGDEFAAGDRIVVAGQTGLKPGALLEAADTDPDVETAPQVTEDDSDKDRSAA